MFLALDIGNSHITLGLRPMQPAAPSVRPWSVTWRWQTQNRTEDEFGLALLETLRYLGVEPAQLHGVGLVSVVPDLTPVLEEACRQYLDRPVFVVRHEEAPLWQRVTLLYDDPRRLGLDRVANAEAALALFGGPVCIVDMGTAITVDAVSHDGAFLGGAIAPGLDMALDMLHQRTAQLPRLRFHHLPPTLSSEDIPVLGTSTEAGIRAGLLHGYAGLLRGLIDEVKRALQARSPETPQVVATGGWASKFEVWLGFDHVVPHLTLEGVYLLWKRWREAQALA